MSGQYPITHVAADAAHAPEQMGTKPKFWFDDPTRGPCLFKLPRADTGEHWAEKVACELSELLGLPHATYEHVYSDPRLTHIAEFYRKAQWRLDFVAAENSMGFHAPQETARVLGEAIDYFRQAQLAAQAMAPATTQPSR